MSSPAREAETRILQQYPDAIIEERERFGLRMYSPSTDRHVLETRGSTPYHLEDETAVDTDWNIGDTPDPSGERWSLSVRDADFELFAARTGSPNFNAGQIIKYYNKTDALAPEHPITFQPQDLNWSYQWHATQFISAPQGVPVEVNGDELSWTGAYGSGTSFHYDAKPGKLAKRFIIDNASAVGSPPAWMDDGTAVLLLKFLFEIPSGVDIYVDGALWNRGERVQTGSRVEFRDGARVLWLLERPIIIDDTGEEPEEEVFYNLTGDGSSVLFVEIRVPWSWMQSASFPVVIDPTITPEVTAGDDDAWESGAGAMNVTGNTISIRSDASTASVRHGGFRFIAALPAGATINSSTLTLSTLADDDALWDLYVERGSPAPPVFTTTTSDISARTRSTAVQRFGPSTAVSDPYTGPDFSAVIQELADNDAPTTAVVLIALGLSGQSRHRYLTGAYESSTADPALLTIDYTVGGVTVDLVASHVLQSDTPDNVILTAVVDLAASHVLQSDTPDNVLLTAVVDLVASHVLQSATNDNVLLVVSVDLVASHLLRSATPDNVILTVGSIINLTADHALQSATPDNVIFTTLLEIVASHVLQSATPDNVILSTDALDLVASHVLQSATNDLLFLVATWELVASHTLQSATNDNVSLEIAGEISLGASHVLQSATPNDVILSQIFGITADHTLRSATPDNVILSTFVAIGLARIILSSRSPSVVVSNRQPSVILSSRQPEIEIVDSGGG